MRYTNTFSVDTNGVAIYRDDNAAGNAIPTDVSVKAFVLEPEPTDGVFPDYYVKGTHEDSDWILVPKETPVYRDDIVEIRSPLLYVKSASGTITMHLSVME